MRVTNNLMIHNMLWNMNNNLSSMNDYNNQLSTGKRIHRPSDDPVGTTKIIKLKTDIVENAQYKENTRDARAWMEISENALTDVKDMLQRIRELAVQTSNDTYTEEQTKKVGKEIEELKKQLVVTANSSIAGRYIFSGFKTDEKLLSEDGTFNIDITSNMINNFEGIRYEVTNGEDMRVSTNQLKAFGYVLNEHTVVEKFPVGEKRTGAATQGISFGTFDYTANYAGSTIAFDVTTTVPATTITYTVSSAAMSTLVGSSSSKIEKDELLEVLRGAKNGSQTLDNVANIYYDINDKLVIEAEEYGVNVASITLSTGTTSSFTSTFTSGIAATTAVVAGSQNYTDVELSVSSWSASQVKTGEYPNLKSSDGIDTIAFTGTASTPTGLFTWNNVDLTTAPSEVKLKRSGDKILLNVNVTDGNTPANNLVLSDVELNYDGEKYSYSENGIDVEVTAKEFKKWQDGAELSLDLSVYNSTSTSYDLTGESVPTHMKNEGIQSFQITVDETTKRIDIDMSAINSTADLQNALQTALDADFKPVGTVTATVSDGSPVSFSVAGKNDGSRVYLKADVIVSDKPQLIKDMETFITALDEKDNGTIGELIGKIDKHFDNVITEMAEIGAKENRLKFIDNRIDDNEISYTSLLSKVQDIDYSQTIIKFKSLESIYRASLSVGAKVIQPTLVDFIK